MWIGVILLPDFFVTIAAKFQLATNRIFHMPESFISDCVQYLCSVLCVYDPGPTIL